ncbi:MAG: hypothetical protein AAFR61_04290 [Bacteroidota bacterium]
MQTCRNTGFQPVKPSAAAASCGYARWESRTIGWHHPGKPAAPASTTLASLPHLQAPPWQTHHTGKHAVTLASSR